MTEYRRKPSKVWRSSALAGRQEGKGKKLDALDTEEEGTADGIPVHFSWKGTVGMCGTVGKTPEFS